MARVETHLRLGAMPRRLLRASRSALAHGTPRYLPGLRPSAFGLALKHARTQGTNATLKIKLVPAEAGRQ